MGGHAYFGTGANKIKHISFYHNNEMKKIKHVWHYHNGVYTQVWTGASAVSYYDGDRLIGVEEIDENEDVLRPQHIDTTKEGYTLYGWKLNPDDNSRVESLVATGEPITLYAYYVPNTLLVYSGTITPDLWVEYTENSRNGKYVSGRLFAGASLATYGWNHGEWSRDNASFYVSMEEYSKYTVYYSFRTGNGSSHSCNFDNTGRITQEGSWSRTYTKSKSFALYAEGYASANSWVSNDLGVTAITLKEPNAWT